MREGSFRPHLTSCVVQRATFHHTDVSGATWKDVAAERLSMDRTLAGGLQIDGGSIRGATVALTDLRNASLKGVQMNSAAFT